MLLLRLFRLLHSPPDPDRLGSGTSLILTLPPELIRLICDFMTIDAQCSLALTCRRLNNQVGSSVFRSLNNPDPNSRLQKSHFLRKLRRDNPDPSLWICYRCICFHTLEQRVIDRPIALGVEMAVGLPSCDSKNYTAAINSIYARLYTPKHLWLAQNHWEGRGRYQWNVCMDYYVTCASNARNLYMRRKYTIYTNRTSEFDIRLMTVPSIFEKTNLEICRHVWFGSDWTRGDGSVMDRLNEYGERQRKEYEGLCDEENRESWSPEVFTGFICQECRLELEVRCLKSLVMIAVWQHVGRLGKRPRNLMKATSGKQKMKSPWAIWRGWALRSRPEPAPGDRGGLRPGELKRRWISLPPSK